MLAPEYAEMIRIALRTLRAMYPKADPKIQESLDNVIFDLVRRRNILNETIYLKPKL